MYPPTRSERKATRWLLVSALFVAGMTGAAPALDKPLDAQEARIVSSEVALSRDVAGLTIEVDGGRSVRIALRNGVIEIDGVRAGTYDRNGRLDRAWRDLLNDAMEASGDDLVALLKGWQAPDGEAGARISEALASVLDGARTLVVRGTLNVGGNADAEAPTQDTIERLNERIRELEARLRESSDEAVLKAELRQEIEREVHERLRREQRAQQSDRGWARPFRYIGKGMTGLVSTLSTFLVMALIGFAVVFFGRKYLEGVADTARHATLRSGLVGLAASFLVLPVFILGIIGLVISIVGIPLLLVWIPLFPIAVVLAAAFGYLAVAHAAGEALAERRFYGGDWFRLGNSYYYVLTGLGILLALFIAAHVVQMAGPWFNFLYGLLKFLAVMLTWAAVSIGLGAVLLSRAGTQPQVPAPEPEPETPSGLFEEEANV